MCTVVLAAHAFAGHPLVVVANRDERLDRTSSSPFVWPAGFLAPRDEVAHGTWLGVNPSGVFVGITNRYLGPNDATRVSRGALVSDALMLGSARAIHAALATLPAARHNGFHLVYADADDVLATVSTGTAVAQVTLGHGIHVLTERSFGAGDESRRRERIHAAWERLVARPADAATLPTLPTLDLERLSRLLTEHDEEEPFAATCIHVPGFGYGTRSATALAIDDAHRSRMLWAEGPPCTTPMSPVSGLPENG